MHNDTALWLGNDVQKRLRGWRRRLLGQRLLYALAATAVVLLIGHWLATPSTTVFQQVLALCIVSFAQLRLSTRWRNLNTDNFLQHLNRRFPDFEESAQLLTREPSSLGPLQLLQRERAHAVFRKNLAQVEKWQTPFYYRWAVIILLSCGLLFMLTDQLALLASKIIPENLMMPVASSGTVALTGLNDITVRIRPPAYTGLAEIETDQLNLELPQGSQVDWSLSFATNDGEFALQVSSDVHIALTSGKDNRLHGGAVIDKTDLYRIVRNHAGEEDTVGDIYSLTVKLDRAPDIRVIEPAV